MVINILSKTNNSLMRKCILTVLKGLALFNMMQQIVRRVKSKILTAETKGIEILILFRVRNAKR